MKVSWHAETPCYNLRRGRLVKLGLPDFEPDFGPVELYRLSSRMADRVPPHHVVPVDWRNGKAFIACGIRLSCMHVTFVRKGVFSGSRPPPKYSALTYEETCGENSRLSDC